jgi:hypothetical protein
MLNALTRKARQLLADPVLRRWLVGRVLGRWSGEPAFEVHRPPYAAGRLPLAPQTPRAATRFRDLPPGRVDTAITLDLAGTDVTLSPSYGADLMTRAFDDTETLLALHRFAWLPVAGPHVDPAWVGALWTAWRDAHGTPDATWAWHPYTAAERAINLIDFSRRVGLPGPFDETLACLAAHAPVIAERLEFFGDHHTSNHLANNGRGLYRLGLDLGLPDAAALGRDILLNEAERLFRPSGVLREGSTHYHRLLTRGYMDAWLAAERHARPEAAALKAIAGRAAGAAAALRLPGGVPLIGDISPDCPPNFLFDGWRSLLPEDDQARAQALMDQSGQTDALTADGWAVETWGAWALMAFADPDGWPHMPGHGHQDAGSFELHRGDTPVVVDPGRGRYGDDGDAALYRSAAVHSGLTVDGADPYPANRPYYDDAFRRRVGGPPPVWTRTDTGLALTVAGFGRLGGVGPLTRTWTANGDAVVISDRIDGRGRRQITRRLVLADEPVADGGTWRAGSVRIRFDGPARVETPTLWRAYGRGRPGWALVAEASVALPFNGAIRIEGL